MKGLSKRKRFRLTLATSLFLVLSIPVVLLASLTQRSLDPSSDAGETSPIAYCTISFPYVNPLTIEAGKTVQLQVNATAPEIAHQITGITIRTSRNEQLFNGSYSQGVPAVKETFTLKTDMIGEQQIFGQMETSGGNHPCIMEGYADSGSGNVIKTLSVNSAPVFATDPYESATPSNSINPGTEYKYEMVVNDHDGDPIQFAYSFTPNADWLNMSVLKNGQNGELVLLFQGVAEGHASYLANVFVHDGYNKHLRSQSWVISVEPADNDTPQVKVTNPSTDSSIPYNGNITVTWNATDRNQITGYKLYYATNPGNEQTWKLIDGNISHNVNSYIVNGGELGEGQYKFIVEATDNQNPPLSGIGVSSSISVGAAPVTPTDPQPGDEESPPEDEETPEPDDGPIIADAQILNINPTDGSSITNPRRTISATLVASNEAEVVRDSIQFKLDGRDLTDQLELSEISPSEITIIYKPTEDLSSGEHKIDLSFEDSEQFKVERSWAFTVEAEKSDDLLNIFGFEITPRLGWIIVIGIGIIILALLVPWLLYLAWRDKDDETTNIYTISPSSGPTGSKGGSDFSPFTHSGTNRYYAADTTNNMVVPEPEKKSTSPYLSFGTPHSEPNLADTNGDGENSTETTDNSTDQPIIENSEESSGNSEIEPQATLPEPVRTSVDDSNSTDSSEQVVESTPQHEDFTTLPAQLSDDPQEEESLEMPPVDTVDSSQDPLIATDEQQPTEEELFPPTEPQPSNDTLTAPDDPSQYEYQGDVDQLFATNVATGEALPDTSTTAPTEAEENRDLSSSMTFVTPSQSDLPSQRAAQEENPQTEDVANSSALKRLAAQLTGRNNESEISQPPTPTDESVAEELPLVLEAPVTEKSSDAATPNPQLNDQLNSGNPPVFVPKVVKREE